ncbi:MAG: DNA-directed RNA polymerase subunit beta', partial [Clostridia bacterium]|nr:DNA-directed RNA polymerase subunit beta' [Clostridia bacterium]
HPVMLNRAPTLHRLGIQAFEPVLVEGRAIRLHPLVCTAFNADFDGDQMAVHVPLSAEAQAEARFLMLAANNLLKPSDGRPVAVPTQDMILGSYYLTMVNDNNPENSNYNPDDPYEPGAAVEAKDENGNVITDENGNPKLIYKTFTSVDEAMMAYDEGDIGLHVNIRIRMSKEVDGEVITKLVTTTLGKVIFNNPVPQDLGFIDRTDPENIFRPEVDVLVNKKMLGKIIDRCIKVHGTAIAADVLDKIKAQGYRYSTRSGITVAVCDATIPPQKKELLARAEKKVDDIYKSYDRGLITNDERSEGVIKAWDECSKAVASELKKNFRKFNPINMMLDSGARGNDSQLRQLAGMRGLIANTAGKTIEVPIKANYREGLNISEYFISSRGARKGLADTALRTADSGYLTRRLVDVSQDVIIREEDCHCHDGIEVYDITEGKEMIEPLYERLTGRFLLEDFVDADGNVIASKDEMITEEKAKVVAEMVNARENPADRKIKIRSLLTCDSEHGVCIKCYGANLATGNPVTVGEAVGIIAAQSIGEPGTQLTMRTFHTGGVASSQDITQGLPRVEELFEARKPKTLAILSEIDGVLSFREIKGNEHIVITDHENGDERAYMIPYGFHKRFNSETDENGNPIFVKKGTALTDGSPNPNDILAINGVDAVHDYLIKEVQRTYRMQGVDINDKHIEVIVRQMMRKLKVADAGTTDLLPGASTDKRELAQANEAARLRAEETGSIFVPATSTPVLLGITKASLATDSFLSAASFQETTRVLTDAAIKGKIDPLMGLKENVIIGKLLPSGTGMKCYSEVELNKSIADLVSTEA